MSTTEMNFIGLVFNLSEDKSEVFYQNGMFTGVRRMSLPEFKNFTSGMVRSKSRNGEFLENPQNQLSDGEIYPSAAPIKTKKKGEK